MKDLVIFPKNDFRLHTPRSILFHSTLSDETLHWYYSYDDFPPTTFVLSC